MVYVSAFRMDHHLKTLTVASAVSSFLSIIGILYIIGRYWYARRLKSKSLSVYTASAHHLDVTKELIHILAYLDLFGAIGRAFGVLPTETFNQAAGEHVTAVCKLQAFIITFGDGAPIAWNFIMALNLYRWVCLGEDQQMLMTKIKWYIGGTLLCTLSIPTLCLVCHKFGDADLWCWIVVDSDPAEELWWMIGALYFWVVAGATAMASFLVLVKMNMKKRLKAHANDDANDAYYAVVHNLTVYISGFILCWLPAVLDRVYVFFSGQPSFPLELLHATIVPLQGFINAVIYGKFHIWVVRHVREPWLSTEHCTSSTKQSKCSDELLLHSMEMQAQERQHMGTATLFVTTFDMDWRPCPRNLHDWIPPGKDLYVFSLQHCLEVQAIEQKIRGYLLQVNYPTAYRSITSIAGTSTRGPVQDAAVCQIVFVNNADDASGNVKFDAADGRIWAQRKTFHEVVGIPLRYFDASIAFVSCNLSPSRVTNNNNNNNNPTPHPTNPTSTAHPSHRPTHPRDVSIEAKHAVASRLIHSFNMNADRAAVDFPNLYHHTILSGNLNFDIDMPTSSLLAALDQAYKAASLQRATDSAIEAQIQAIHKKTLEPRHSTSTPPPIDVEEGQSRNWRWSRQNSSTSISSIDDTTVYDEILTSCDDNLPFTVLQSPQDVDKSGLFDPFSMSKLTNWRSFLDVQLPLNGSEPSDASTNSKPSVLERLTSRGGKDKVRTYKKIRDLVVKSDLVADNTARKWLEVLRFDELRAAIEAKEVFTGFDEPAIGFLPTFPRQRGRGASFSMVGEHSCRDFFIWPDNTDETKSRPAYKDRILVHSLSDTKSRLKNVKYWSCEAIKTSSHKPVCSLYELEIDRYFSYNMDEAAVADLRQGHHALREKRDMREFRVKLVHLDVNMWTYAERDVSRRRGFGSYLDSSRHTTGKYSRSSRNPSTSPRSSASFRHSNSAVRPKSSLAQFVGRVWRKSSRLRSGSSGGSSRTNHGTESTNGVLPGFEDRFSSLAASRLELIPVDPVRISTIFPLPSEDVYALQRKVYEVAHLVQNGFQSSAKSDGQEEDAQLAYTNFRTVSWTHAMAHGVTHSAITKTVNGNVHIAISIESSKGEGGQGVLCLHEADLRSHAASELGAAKPLSFDVALTWGGRHVGYLHGDVLCAM